MHQYFIWTLHELVIKVDNIFLQVKFLILLLHTPEKVQIQYNVVMELTASKIFHSISYYQSCQLEPLSQRWIKPTMRWRQTLVITSNMKGWNVISHSYFNGCLTILRRWVINQADNYMNYMDVIIYPCLNMWVCFMRYTVCEGSPD